MNFQDAINKILHDVNHPEYVPYITMSGKIPTASDTNRSDYNDTTQPVRGNLIHGGVDIIFGKMVNNELKYIGLDPQKNPDASVNLNASVYSPVEGYAWRVAGTGTVIIRDHYGYYHIIRHMSNIPSTLSTNANNPTEINANNINTFALGIMSNKDLTQKPGQPPPAIHVHYEITTFYDNDPHAAVQKYQKIDPEAFWNNYPTDPVNGFFLLSGSYKANNQFYGTSSKEILRGEGDHSSYDIVDGGKILNDNSDNDTLSGGGGSDIIDGGSGNDKLFGGNEYEIGKYYKIDSGKLIRDQLIVKEDADESNDTLIGGMGSDYLSGGRGNDVLYGGVATISGSEVFYLETMDPDESNDILVGGEGNDKIYGGKGNDFIFGGPGDDVLYGGSGNDIYFVNIGDGIDTIEDKIGVNKVVLNGKGIGSFYFDSSSGKYKSVDGCLLYTSPSPRDRTRSRMPSSA